MPNGLKKNFFWSLLGNGFNVVFQFLSLVILSKLLSATEYGIIGIMTIFISLGDMLVDSGLSGALLQKKNVVERDFSTLFIFNMAVSLFIYAIVFFIAPWLESFYEVESLSNYIRIYSLSIVIYALCVSQSAKLIRNMQFKTSTIILIISSTVSLALAIVLAIKGYGVYALIYQKIAYAVCRTICLYITNGFFKDFHFSFFSFKEQFNFGGWLLGANIMQTISNNIYSNIIPKIGTLRQNGLFSQSQKINNVPGSVVTLAVGRVLFPYLSKAKDEATLLYQARETNRNLFAIVLPMFFFLSIVSYPIIMIVFGKEWVDATHYLEILFLSGIGIFIQGLMRNILKSLGYTKQIFLLEIIKSVILLSVAALSIKWGINALLYGIVVVSIVNCFISMSFMNHLTSYSFLQQLEDFGPVLMLSCISYIVMYAINALFFKDSFWSLGLFFLGYALYVIIGKLFRVKQIDDLIVFLIRHEK